MVPPVSHRSRRRCEALLKTLRIIARLNIGGPARHAAILEDGLRRRGVETLLVHGVAAPDEGTLEDLVHLPGLRVLCLPDLGRRIRPTSDLVAIARLMRIIFSERPDVVHTHTAKAGTLGRLAALAFNATRRRRHRCLVVHTFHGHVFSGYFGRAGSWAARLVERLLARVTDYIVTISPRQRDEIVDRWRVAPAARVRVVPLGLELGALLDATAPAANLRGEFGLEPDDFVVGYIGRLVPIKDLPTLLEGFAAAFDRLPRLRLMLVGDGPLRQELMDRATRLGISRAVRFVGWRRDLPAVYASLDLVILTSLNEGTPVALIEAMAAGRTVVATDVGGVADVVTDGRTGLLIPPANPPRLAEALIRMANRPDEARRLGAAARGSVVRFRAERLVDDIWSLYRDGLSKKRGVHE